MKINFLVNQVFNGWTPFDTRLGGTEEGVVQWAELFARKGHEVTVWQNGFVGEYFGVQYKDRRDYLGGDGVTLNHKCPEIAPQEPTWYFTTETNADTLDLSKFDGVVWPSRWAADNIPVNNDNVRVIHYGYHRRDIYPDKKIPKQCLYASSPDRGLDTLLSIWPEVVKAHPDAMLIVTYGATPKDVPNTLFMGDVDEATMNDLYRTSDFWVHPCNGGELFGITAVKAQAAGAIPVYFPTMALSETVKYGVKCQTPEEMTRELIAKLGDEPFKEATRKILGQLSYPTWESTGDDILYLIGATSQNTRIEGE